LDELVSRITADTGIDPATVTKAVQAVLAFLAGAVPPETLAPLREAFPDAAGTLDRPAAAPAGGGFGGGVMALAEELGDAGLSMGQMQDFAKSFFAVGREKAGEDTMGSIVASVPGLAQFV
jgi:hypothetical protein